MVKLLLSALWFIPLSKLDRLLVTLLLMVLILAIILQSWVTLLGCKVFRLPRKTLLQKRLRLKSFEVVLPVSGQFLKIVTLVQRQMQLLIIRGPVTLKLQRTLFILKVRRLNSFDLVVTWRLTLMTFLRY